MERLPEPLDTGLRIIADKKNEGMLPAVIKTLLNRGFIAVKFGGGWLVSSKGREYLKKYKV